VFRFTFLSILIFLSPIAESDNILVFYRGSDLIYKSETGDYPDLREVDGYIKGITDGMVPASMLEYS